MTKIYIIAGEASGDLIGSYLLEDLKNHEITGIGGHLMKQKGLNSLFPMEDLSVMGIWEIIPHLPRLIKRIHQTIKDILHQKPDILLTIDSPGFCYRIIKAIKKKDPSIKAFHYVAPSVWAWRTNRAKKVAQFLDHLFCLFPFEPPYFTKHGLKATFAGHPLTRTSFKKEKIEGEHILLLPGSRISEIKTLLPIFVEVAKKIKDAMFYLPTLPHLKPLVESLIPKELKVKVTTNKEPFQIATKAIAASGTVSLELAQYNIPHVIAYKTSYLTGIILKLLVKTKYVALPNILMSQEIVPECLQKKCNTNEIYKQLIQLNTEEQEKALKNVFNRLYCLDETQSISQVINAYSKT